MRIIKKSLIRTVILSGVRATREHERSRRIALIRHAILRYADSTALRSASLRMTR